MPKLLTDMVIEEISVVDDPANEDARMVIVKSKGGFKPCDDCEDPSGCMKKGACAAKAEKRAVPVVKMANAIIAALDHLSDEIVAKAMSEGLSDHPGAEDALAAFLKENLMDFDAIQKALDTANAKIEKQATDIIALTKRAEEAEAKIAKGKGSDDDEDVLKGLPEAVRKRLEEANAKAAAAEAAIAKMAEREEANEAIAKAKAAGLPEADKIGPALLRVSKGKSTAEDATLIEGVLKAAAAQEKTAALFKSTGSKVAVEGDPEAMLKAKAEEIQKRAGNEKMTHAEAYTKAMDENPELYGAYVAKRRTVAA